MNILICSFDTPGYAPNELHKYLLGQDHGIHIISCPAKHNRAFIPGYSHWQNIKYVQEKAVGYYDIAIAPDPAFMVSLVNLRDRGIIGKAIYWRLDYYPRKYPEPFNQAYQALERYALNHADEIWSISDPEIPIIARSLQDSISKTIHVPYLMSNSLQKTDRVRSTLWMGPDLDTSRVLCEEAVKRVDIEFNIADYSIDEFRISDDKLAFFLNRAMVGLSPYRPEKKSPKYFCDSSRIRRFLSYGVPVVTTDVAPTHTTLINEHCGFICEWNTESVEEGINYCLENFDELSRNALLAAEKYTYERWFSDHKILDPSRLNINIL